MEKGSLESYYGTYFTTNLMTALSSSMSAVQKFGGMEYAWPVMFVVQLETRTAVVDEDWLFNILPIFSRKIRANITSEVAEEIIKNWSNYKRDIDGTIKHWINYINNEEMERRPISSQQEDKLKKPLEEWLYQKIKIIAKRGINYDKFTSPELRKATDKVVKTLGNIAKFKKSSFGLNARVTEPVTFRGSNRILAAIGLPNYYGEDKIKLFEV
jgi:hypothetical protein